MRRLPPLRPEDLLTVLVITGAIVWDFIKHASDPDNAQGQWPLRILLVVGTTLLMFAIIAVVYLSVRQRWYGPRLIVALIATIAVAALLKGVVFTWGLVLIGLDDVPQWSFRVPSSVTHMTVVVMLLWAAMTDIHLHYERLAALEAERRELTMLREQTRDQLATLDASATESVRARILAGLASAPSSDAPHVLEQLNRTVDEVVRPLSRQLESQSEQWLPPQQERAPVRINWLKALWDGTDSALIGPAVISVAIVWISLSLNITRGGRLFEAQFLLAILIVFYPSLILARRGAMWLTQRLPPWWRPPVFLISLLSCGLLIGIVLRPFTSHVPKPWMYALLGPMFTVLLGALWAFAVSAHRQARATEAEAEMSSADLRWTITRARELHRQRRRALAHAVHGHVQASLAAAIVQLNSALGDGTASQEAVSAIQRRVTDSVASLDMRTVEPSPIAEVLVRTQATWAGVADITVTIDPALGHRLMGDIQTLTTLNDVIPELVFNSIRHGHACVVSIAIIEGSDRTVTLVVDDDGEADPSQAESGMGSRLLDACALSWCRERPEGRTVTEVILTVADTATA